MLERSKGKEAGYRERGNDPTVLTSARHDVELRIRCRLLVGVITMTAEGQHRNSFIVIVSKAAKIGRRHQSRSIALPCNVDHVLTQKCFIPSLTFMACTILSAVARK